MPKKQGGAPPPKPPPRAPKQNWIQRNPWIATIVAAVFGSTLTTFVGAGIFSFALPRILSHAQSDLTSTIDAEIEKKFKEHDFDGLKNSINTLNGKVEQLTSNVNLLLTKSIKQAAALPPRELREQLPQVASILAAAASRRVPIESGIVQELSRKISPFAAGYDPDAWHATLALADYRSSTQSDFPGQSFGPVGEKQIIATHVNEPGEYQPNVTISPYTLPKSEGAEISRIGMDLNPNNVRLVASFLLKDGSQVLDDWHFKNVIMQNVHVIYHGGPVQLENVKFINCRFSIDHTKRGIEFAERSIASPSVTFTSGD